ncbi:MAG: SH3 domain-containing protein [Caulobacter sp.]|nr:SH3 domain-containing protein [Caulobacter sp.]
MRIAITASVMVAALAAAVPGAAQAGVFGCDSGGGKQEGAAVIGALIGGVVGNKLVKGERGAGTVVGAGIGAAIGSSIGCKMQEEDQRRAEAALDEALATGRPVAWKNPNSGANGEIRVLASNGYGDGYGQPVQLSNVAFARDVQPQRYWVGGGGTWYAARNVNLRAGPTTRSRVVGQLAGGQNFEVLAKVQGQPWLLVGRDGYGVGYVSESVVSPVVRNDGCQTVEQTLYTKKYGRETERYRACRQSGGGWDLTKI